MRCSHHGIENCVTCLKASMAKIDHTHQLNVNDLAKIILGIELLRNHDPHANYDQYEHLGRRALRFAQEAINTIDDLNDPTKQPHPFTANIHNQLMCEICRGSLLDNIHIKASPPVVP